MSSSKNGRRFWWCGGRDGCGHVVGEIVQKDVKDVGRVTALLIYDESLPTPPVDVPPDRGVVVTGYEMPCTLCQSRYTWYPSLDALQKLLSNYQVRSPQEGKL